jgi:hypothetical protein
MLDPNVRFVVRKTACDGIGNVFKCFITGLSANPNTQIECNPDYIFGNYDSVLDRKHIFREGSLQQEQDGPKMRNEYIYTSRLLVLAEEESHQSHIFSDENQEYNGISNMEYNYLYSPNVLIDYNYDPNRICDKVKQRIISVIQTIQFSMVIIDRVYRNVCFMAPTGKRLGISVRTWRSFHEHGIVRPYNFETYANKILEVLNEVPDIQTIVLSFDNHSVEKQYLDLVEQFGKRVIVLMRDDGDICINPLQHSVVKMLSLARCEYFICNRISTFSELVFWFGGCKAKVFPLF